MFFGFYRLYFVLEFSNGEGVFVETRRISYFRRKIVLASYPHPTPPHHHPLPLPPITALKLPPPPFLQLKVMNYNMSEDKQGKPPRRAPTWTQYYFRLKSEVLTKSPPRRSSFLGGGGKSEEMKLSSSTVTSYTNTKNCFCVRTNNVSRGKVCV